MVTGDISAYANRPAVELRWGFVSDGSGQYAGVAIDDVAVTACCDAASCDDNNPCTDDVCDRMNGCTHIGDDANSCSDGNPCTSPDTCSNGACVPGFDPCDDGDACTIEVCDGQGGCAHTPITAPPEVGGLAAAADKATYTWPAALFATQYDVVRGLMAALPVGPGGGDEVCFDDRAEAWLVDATIPVVGNAFWYLVRGENACGLGTYGTWSDGTLRTTTTCP
jgi:hypothetical protein